MKPLFVIILCTLVFNCNEKQHVETTNKDLKPSSKILYEEGTVVPFAPNVFSQFTNVRDFTITPHEREAYFSLQSQARELSVIMRIKKKDNGWSEPEIVRFSGQYTDLEPFLSPDGLQLFFASNRPVSKDSTNVKDFDIWYVKRDQMDLEWSQPINIGAPVNSSFDEYYPSITLSNNMYFTAIKEGMNGQDDIFVSEWKDNAYQEPVALGAGVNTKGAEFNAFVAPDESYILFSGWRRTDGIGSGDLYMSKRVNGEWQTATNLGIDINSKQTDYCPFVNTKSGTLYFTSLRSNVVKKDSGYTNFEELMTEINRYDNGSSRIYKTDFKAFIDEAKK